MGNYSYSSLLEIELYIGLINSIYQDYAMVLVERAKVLYRDEKRSRSSAYLVAMSKGQEDTTLYWEFHI